MQTILQKGMLILYKQERNGNLILPYNCNIKKILIAGIFNFTHTLDANDESTIHLKRK